MTKKILILLVLGLVAAMPAVALAQINPLWTGAISDVFENPANWVQGGTVPTIDPDYGTFMNKWNTPTLEVKGGDPSANPVPELTTALVADVGGIACRPGQLRIFTNNGSNVGAVVNQTAGDVEWRNGAGSASIPYAVVIQGDWHVGDTAVGNIHMTGGSMTTPSLGIGVSPWGDVTDIEGNGVLDIWGDATFQIDTFYSYHIARLQIVDHPASGTSSKIDIRDDGTLSVPLSLQGTVDGYIAGGQIVAGAAGTSLAAAVVGDNYVVSVVPEPGTLLLLCLGLGCLALIRRK